MMRCEWGVKSMKQLTYKYRLGVLMSGAKGQSLLQLTLIMLLMSLQERKDCLNREMDK